MMNSAAIRLDFFKKMDGFVKKQETETACCYQEDCDHFT